MQEQNQRLSKIAREFNVGVDTMLEFLLAQGVEDLNRNSKVSSDVYGKLVDEFQPDKRVKAEAKELKRTIAQEEQETFGKILTQEPILTHLKSIEEIVISKFEPYYGKTPIEIENIFNLSKVFCTVFSWIRKIKMNYKRRANE